jgi:hypothetical protein
MSFFFWRVYNELLSEVILLKVNLSKNNSDIATTITIIIILICLKKEKKIKK